MITVRDILLDAFTRAIIIPCSNSRSFRMRFYSAINSERHPMLKFAFKDHITILGKRGRVIAGPKDFDQKIDLLFNLEKCSQEDLDLQMMLYYPKDMLFNKERAMQSWKEEDQRQREEEQKHIIDPEPMRIMDPFEAIRASTARQKTEQEQNDNLAQNDDQNDDLAPPFDLSDFSDKSDKSN